MTIPGQVMVISMLLSFLGVDSRQYKYIAEVSDLG